MNLEYIIDQYANVNRTVKDIANELSYSQRTISSKLRNAGIPTKRRIKQDLKQDITGQKFGKITVIKLEKCDKNNDYLWLCQCECGTEKSIIARSLLRTDSPVNSCGCTRTNGVQWKYVPPFFVSGFRKNAKVRNIPFHLTVEYCDEIFKKQNGMCAISGLSLVFGRRRARSETTASIDRINSSLSYEEGNIQFVHKQVNIMKHVLSNEELITLCKQITEYNK